MPALTIPLYLCADGGGTSVTVTVASASGGILARGQAGPCNVKTVGPQAAIEAILRAVSNALTTLDFNDAVDWTGAVPTLHRRVFKRVWLGLAGIGPREDVDAFSAYAYQAFKIPVNDESLRITNDGHLLASPCSMIPQVDAAVVLVAGTGTVGFSFRKAGARLDLAGVTGGWGYLLGDEGSAYNVGRLACRALLQDEDLRQSQRLLNPSIPLPKLLPLYHALLAHLDVPSAAALVDKTYSDHSSSSPYPTFERAEAARKVWIAEAARVVFSFAFGGKDGASEAVARSIAKEAVQELVGMGVLLVGDRSVIKPERTALALGGGLWNVQGFMDLLTEGLKKQHGITFAKVVRVGDPADAGVKALVAQDELQ